MVVTQFVELDIFLETFERGMAGELLQARDMHPLRDPARDCTAAQAVAGERRTIEPGRDGPFLDDQRDRIGVDRLGTNPVVVGYRFASGTPLDARRRQTPQPAKQRPFADFSGREPGFEGSDRTQAGSQTVVPWAFWSFLRHGRNNVMPSS
jgi:hypothetical protein